MTTYKNGQEVLIPCEKWSMRCNCLKCCLQMIESCEEMGNFNSYVDTRRHRFVKLLEFSSYQVASWVVVRLQYMAKSHPSYLDLAPDPDAFQFDIQQGLVDLAAANGTGRGPDGCGGSGVHGASYNFGGHGTDRFAKRNERFEKAQKKKHSKAQVSLFESWFDRESEF